MCYVEDNVGEKIRSQYDLSRDTIVPTPEPWIGTLHAKLSTALDIAERTSSRLSNAGFYDKPVEVKSGAESTIPDTLRYSIESRVKDLLNIITRLERQVENLC